MSDIATAAEPVDETTAAESSSARRSRRGVAIAIAAALLAVAGVITGLALTSDPDPTTHTYVIPLGTSDRIAAGQEIRILPDVLEIRQGDRMVITNDDDVVHTIGPYTIRPNEIFDVTYSRVGVYPGPCTFNNDGRTIISVS